MAKKNRPEQALEPALEVLGKCPEEGCDGNVKFHLFKDYAVCSRRFEGTCEFTLNRDYLKSWGIKRLTKKDVRDLLACPWIHYDGMWNPTGRYRCDCRISLQWIPVKQKMGLKIDIVRKYGR